MTKRFAIIGDPVAHSLSPLMHNAWFADHGIDAHYEALHLPANDAVAAIRRLRNLAGANVTVPHKEAAAKAATQTESEVANVLRWEADGSLLASNTDGVGFLDALDESAPDWRMRAKHALIIGAGGAAVSIGKALSPHVERLVFVNRTLERAKRASAPLPNGSALGWTEIESGFADADLIVQATTLGMSGQPKAVWPVSACRTGAIIADIVYRPLHTELLRAARARGLATVDGLGMLIHQGVRSFDLWFGVKPDAEKARTRLLAALT